MIFITFLWFILGIVFISFVYPLMDEVLALLLTGLSVLKGRLQVKIAKMRKEVEALDNEEEYHPPQIGFVITDDMEEEEDEDL